jgi:hypothetical protein
MYKIKNVGNQYLQSYEGSKIKIYIIVYGEKNFFFNIEVYAEKATEAKIT